MGLSQHRAEWLSGGLHLIILVVALEAETLWAREIQSRAPLATPLAAPTAPKRSASRGFR